MRHSTYSFLDLAGAIAHPFFPLGVFQFTGEGVGSISVAMSTDRTAHDVAADGSIMISKIAGNNGQISIECQQTSLVHKYLLNLFNYVWQADTSQWAMIAIALRNISDGTSHICTGVSFGKKADKAYKSAGERVTWTLWAADISSMNA
jgi:hypothetical protein